MLAPSRTSLNHRIALGRPDGGSIALLGGFAITVAFAMVVGVALQRYPPPSVAILTLAGLGALALLILVITRYDFAVGLAFVLLGVVKFEPAPVDLLFGTLILVAVVTGRLDLRRIPLAAAGGLAAFILLNVVSMVDAIAPGQAAFYFALTLYGAVLVVWLGSYLNSVRRSRMIVRCYLAAAVITASLGLSALALPFPGAEDLLYGGDGERVQALFKDPNVFAPFLIPITLILLEEMLSPRLLRMSGLWKALMMGVLISGILLSGSRAAWLSLALGVVVMLAALSLRRGGGQRAFAAIAVIVTGVIVATLIVSLTDTASLLDDRATVQAYDSARFEKQAEGISLAAQHPLGLGPGQFDIYSPLAIHSLYLRALAEQGVLGLAALLAFVLATLGLALRNAVAGRDSMGIGSAALLGAWVGLLANSIVIDSLHWRHLWVVAGLVWAGWMHSEASRERAPEPAS